MTSTIALRERRSPFSRAVRVVGPGSMELTDAPEPEPGGDVLVVARQVGICGTDTKIVAGTPMSSISPGPPKPSTWSTTHQAMKVLMTV